MTQLLSTLFSIFRPAHLEEKAQDTFEYILVIGVLVVAVIGFAMLAPNIMTTVVESTRTAVLGLFA
jgi:hypothetical protein